MCKNIKRIKIINNRHDSWYTNKLNKTYYTDLNLNLKFEVLDHYIVTNEYGNLIQDGNNNPYLIHKNDVEVINENSYNCIVCDTKIKALEANILDNNKPYNRMWDDGIVDIISAGYGSRKDGDIYIIGICDNCVEQKLKNNKITFYKDYLNG